MPRLPRLFAVPVALLLIVGITVVSLGGDGRAVAAPAPVAADALLDAAPSRHPLAEPRGGEAHPRVPLAADAVPNLAPGQRWAVQVRDAAATAVPGAEVRALACTGDSVAAAAPSVVATTDLDGRAEVWLPDAVLFLEAGKEGVGRSGLVRAVFGQSEVVLTLRREATIAGRVLDALGSTVPGALVRATVTGARLSSSLPVAPAPVRTDDAGRFHTTAEPDVHFQLVADDGHQLSLPVDVRTEAGGRHEVLLCMAGAWSIAGVVVDAANAPGRGYVRVARDRRHEPSADDEPRRVVVGSDGRFSVAVDGPGRFLVQALGEDSWSEPAAVEVAFASPHPEVTLRFPPTGAIAGRVVTDGRACAGARVRIVPERRPGQVSSLPSEEQAARTPIVTTDHDGRFRVEALPAGGASYEVFIYPDAKNMRVVARRGGVRPGDDELHFALTALETRGAVLTLVLTHADDGSPVRDVEAALVFPRAGGGVVTAPLPEVDGDGRLTLPPLSPLIAFGVSLRPTGRGRAACAPVHVGPIELTGDETRRVRLQRAASVTVRVLDRDGRPRAGRQVVCVCAHPLPDAPPGIGRATDARGEVRFERLPPGELEVRLPAGRAARTVVLTPGANPDVVMQLQ